jgi:hypothetical protein
MVVGYMGLEGMPATLSEIPLEKPPAAGIRQLSTHPTVDGDHVEVLCASVVVSAVPLRGAVDLERGTLS